MDGLQGGWRTYLDTGSFIPASTCASASNSGGGGGGGMRESANGGVMGFAWKGRTKEGGMEG